MQIKFILNKMKSNLKLIQINIKFLIQTLKHLKKNSM